MTQRKLVKQKKRIKDYKKRKNIIDAWKKHVVSLINNGFTGKLSNPKVEFPKRKIIKKK